MGQNTFGTVFAFILIDIESHYQLGDGSSLDNTPKWLSCNMLCLKLPRVLRNSRALSTYRISQKSIGAETSLRWLETGLAIDTESHYHYLILRSAPSHSETSKFHASLIMRFDFFPHRVARFFLIFSAYFALVFFVKTFKQSFTVAPLLIISRESSRYFLKFSIFAFSTIALKFSRFSFT